MPLPATLAQEMELVAVAAVAENGAIGKDGEIPWTSVPADRSQYRARVAEHPVIMGRQTFESMLEDLPGRIQIVLSRTMDSVEVPSARVVGSVADAIAVATAAADDRAYVLGGGEIYALFFPHLDRLLVSRIPGEYDADTWFPDIDPAEWELLRTEECPGFVLEMWARRRE